MALLWQPPLPPFGGGLAVFRARAARERAARGELLAVPPVPAAAAQPQQQQEDGAAQQHGAGWWQRAGRLADELGCSAEGPHALGGVLAAAPRSRAERAVSKHAFAAMCRQLQPGALVEREQQQAVAAPGSLQDAARRACADFAAAGRRRAPRELDERVFLPADSCWQQRAPRWDDWLAGFGTAVAPAQLPDDVDAAARGVALPQVRACLAF